MYLAKLDINQEHTSFSQKCFDMNVPSSINRMNNLKVSTTLNCKLQRENNLKASQLVSKVPTTCQILSPLQSFLFDLL